MSIVGSRGVLFGGAAIYIHDYQSGSHGGARNPEDIDVFGPVALLAVCLVRGGYVRTGAHEFRSVDNVLPVQLWDSGRQDLPHGVPPALAIPLSIVVNDQIWLVASPLDLLLMKRLTVRRDPTKSRKDKHDIEVLKRILATSH
jgi:hypothetical protein